MRPGATGGPDSGHSREPPTTALDGLIAFPLLKAMAAVGRTDRRQFDRQPRSLDALPARSPGRMLVFARRSGPDANKYQHRPSPETLNFSATFQQLFTTTRSPLSWPRDSGKLSSFVKVDGDRRTITKHNSHGQEPTGARQEFMPRRWAAWRCYPESADRPGSGKAEFCKLGLERGGLRLGGIETRII